MAHDPVMQPTRSWFDSSSELVDRRGASSEVMVIQAHF